ncbi:MAG: ThuA domain-containing protein [Armatimonadota bacterium]|nr:ThuA domain-containing protein [Armatimonadota bacterium]MDW8024562.1 ThuA domain-containing protein [Armatimonadota bacterium]
MRQWKYPHALQPVKLSAIVTVYVIAVWALIGVTMRYHIGAAKGLPPLEVKPDAPRLEEAKKSVEELPKVNAPCYVCHLNYAQEELSLIHAKANVGCMSCHGKSEAHRGDEFNKTPPDVMFAKDAINSFCATCHKRHDAPAQSVILRWFEKSYGTKPETLVCTDCHGEHRLSRRRVLWEKRTGKLLPSPGAVAKPKETVNALIVTGVDHPAHNWRETTPALVKLLEADKRISVRVIEDPHMLDSQALHRYDVIILHFMNWETTSPGWLARENIKQFVGGGKGLVVLHFACGAWQDWEEFVQLAGRIWDPKLRPHDPRGRFKVEIVNPNHPVTMGLQSFETDDELYTCLSGEPQIEVLAVARSKVDGLSYPVAFVHRYRYGRVFHCTLGHDVKALSAPEIGVLLRRGVMWAGGHLPAERHNR